MAGGELGDLLVDAGSKRQSEQRISIKVGAMKRTYMFHKVVIETNWHRPLQKNKQHYARKILSFNILLVEKIRSHRT